MKRHIEKTSLEAYNVISLELSERQNEVYEIIKEFGPISNAGISRKLSIPINSVTPRVYELREIGIVIRKGTAKDPYTSMTVIVWGIPTKLKK
jgi:DNA-binding Lrp family transcriptional regulator